MIKIKYIFSFALLISLLGCKNDDKPDQSGSFIGDIVLQTQAQIEDFGKNGYSTIEGSIWIGGLGNDPRDIVSLSPLLSIDSIKGDLRIIATTTLPNLGGLQNLKHVSGRVAISHNSDLVSINGLENLQTIGEGFSIASNSSLENFSTTMALTSVGESLSFHDLDVSSLDVFQNLTTVGSLSLSNLRNIINIDGFASLQSIGLRLDIFHNARLENIKGLSNMNGVLDIQIQDNSALASLEGLEGITNATGIYLRSNPGLTDLTGLNNISNFRGNLIIAENENLESFNGLQTNISFVQDRSTLSFWSLPKLQSLEEYTFSGKLSDLVFGDLPLIEKLPTLVQQDSVVTLVIAENDRLINIDELHEIIFGADIQILKNPLLENVNGLSALNSTYRLLIRQNPTLTNIDGFASLDEVIQSITIEINQALSDFCGLTNAASAGGLSGTYTISENGFNPSLQDIIDGNCSN